MTGLRTTPKCDSDHKRYGGHSWRTVCHPCSPCAAQPTVFGVHKGELSLHLFRATCTAFHSPKLNLEGVALQGILPPDVPIISVSKGLELGTGKMMSEVIPQALGRRQPTAFLSGPSFAKEVMDLQPTGVVAASKVHPIKHPLRNRGNRGIGRISCTPLVGILASSHAHQVIDCC